MKEKTHLIYGIIIGILLCACVGSSIDDQKEFKEIQKVFCKGGAEGVFLFADLKGGIVGIIKVIDGNERAIPFTVYNIFKKFKIMNNSELKKIEKFYSFKLRNHAKITVGSINSKID